MSLVDDVPEMFAALNGYETYEAVLALWCWRWHAEKRERDQKYRIEHPGGGYRTVKAWRRANPGKFRELHRRNEKRRRDKPGFYQSELYRAAKQRYRDKHREHVREVNRKNQAARRARLKTQKQKEAV